MSKRRLPNYLKFQLVFLLMGVFTVVVGSLFGERIIRSSKLMPHEMCLLWNPELITLHVISDSIVALAYFSILFFMLKILLARPDLIQPWMYAFFVSFIFWCGMTHVMAIVIIWEPYYWVDGFIKAVTAAISFGTATAMATFLRNLMGQPTEGQYQEAIFEGLELKNKLDQYMNRYGNL